MNLVSRLPAYAQAGDLDLTALKVHNSSRAFFITLLGSGNLTIPINETTSPAVEYYKYVLSENKEGFGEEVFYFFLIMPCSLPLSLPVVMSSKNRTVLTTSGLRSGT